MAKGKSYISPSKGVSITGGQTTIEGDVVGGNKTKYIDKQTIQHIEKLIQFYGTIERVIVNYSRRKQIRLGETISAARIKTILRIYRDHYESGRLYQACQHIQVDGKDSILPNLEAFISLFDTKDDLTRNNISKNNIILVGEPKFGRTSLLEALCYSLATNGVLESSVQFLPFFLSFKSWPTQRSKVPLQRLCSNYFSDIYGDQTHLNSGSSRFVFLFDDLQQIPPTKFRDLLDFLSQFDHYCLVASFRSIEWGKHSLEYLRHFPNAQIIRLGGFPNECIQRNFPDLHSLIKEDSELLELCEWPALTVGLGDLNLRKFSPLKYHRAEIMEWWFKVKIPGLWDTNYLVDDNSQAYLAVLRRLLERIAYELQSDEKRYEKGIGRRKLAKLAEDISSKSVQKSRRRKLPAPSIWVEALIDSGILKQKSDDLFEFRYALLRNYSAASWLREELFSEESIDYEEITKYCAIPAWHDPLVILATGAMEPENEYVNRNLVKMTILSALAAGHYLLGARLATTLPSKDGNNDAFKSYVCALLLKNYPELNSDSLEKDRIPELILELDVEEPYFSSTASAGFLTKTVSNLLRFEGSKQRGQALLSWLPDDQKLPILFQMLASRSSTDMKEYARYQLQRVPSDAFVYHFTRWLALAPEDLELKFQVLINLRNAQSDEVLKRVEEDLPQELGSQVREIRSTQFFGMS